MGSDALIIIISAYDWTEIEEEARAAGADAFITKPMFQSTLYNALLSCSRRTPVSSQREKEKETPPDLSGKRLLLAEDNELNREIATEFLKTTGAAIDAAVNGEEAVRLFARSAPHTYAAVFMDVQMPIMDGHQATRAIRALPRSDAGAVPIIAMTANAFAEDIAAALEAGMNRHLGKPIDMGLLLRTLRELIADSVPSSENAPTDATPSVRIG